MSQYYQTSVIGTTLSFVSILMTTATLFLIIANSCKFLRTKEMRKPLIVLFYAFSFTNVMMFLTTALLREYARKFSTGSQKAELLNFVHGPMTASESLSLACTFSIDGITMLQLGLSIQLVLQKQSMRRISLIQKINGLLQTAVLVGVAILYFNYQGQKEHHKVRIVVDSSILLINAAMLVFLLHQLHQLGTFIQQAIRSVQLQFLAFVIANLLTCVSDFYFGFIASDIKNDKSTVVTATMHFTENVAVLGPICYVLITHRKALSQARMALMQKHTTSCSETVSQSKHDSINEGSSFQAGIKQNRISADTCEAQGVQVQPLITESVLSQEQETYRFNGVGESPFESFKHSFNPMLDTIQGLQLMVADSERTTV